MMEMHLAALEAVVPLQTVLGYLNFSEGRPDPRFQKQLSDAYAFLAERGAAGPRQALHNVLKGKLANLHKGDTSAFRDVHQAEAVLGLVFDRLLPAYRKHHADLLFHQTDDLLFGPFFLARACEAVLAQGGPWEEEERIVKGALRQLNDYVGHRPIAVLESRPRGEPYEHERMRPVPLYLHGAGVGWGPYRELIQQGLEILRKTDQGILQEACFDLELLEELAFDPRGYDFGHPADKRPNYLFGEWDPHHIDGKGRYRRFVVRQIVLDALLARLQSPRARLGQAEAADPDDPCGAGEMLVEAATVLAGTILMAAGMSGIGPQTHDSSTTLTTLVPRIARYRDAFYASLLRTLAPEHAARLKKEAVLTRQPFGGARQHLNHHIAGVRARQLQQRHLALLFAQIGDPEASRRQAAIIPVASSRLLTEMHMRLTTGRLLVQQRKPDQAAKLLPEVEDLLHRAIDCGAVMDPWNLLGFQGQYPRFTALEDSVRDPRIEELFGVVSGLLNLYAQVLSEGAAHGTFSAGAELSGAMKRLADWWDRFATVEVSDVPRVHGGEALASAEHVAEALARWRERGSGAADLAFWREHLDRFTSPKAFALVVDALLHKEDYRAAMALLMTWLGQHEQVPLEEGEHSFHTLAMRWLLGISTRPGRSEGTDPTAADRLAQVGKFFDYLEANAEEYWDVPRPELTEDEELELAEEADPEEDDPYRAAYEDVTFKDSSGDDVEAEVLDFMPQKDFDLTHEAERLERHVRFLATVSRLWSLASRLIRGPEKPTESAARNALMGRAANWLARARANYRDLLNLLDIIHQHEIPQPSGNYESLVEFDRRRLMKEGLLGVILATCLDTRLAMGALRGALGNSAPASEDEPAWEATLLGLEQAFWAGEAAMVRRMLPGFLEEFREEPLLFTPLSDGGNPRLILRAGLAQAILRGLAVNLPRLGLIRETLEVVRTAHTMEKEQPLAGSRMTEFDRLLLGACQAVVEAVLAAVGREEESPTQPAREKNDAERLATVLESIIEPFLALWVEYTTTLRVAALESVATEKDWKAVRDFISRYGRDLFHARFMALGNLRGILHRGVGSYLDYLIANPDPLHPILLMDELDNKVPRARAERILHTILQAVIENYDEYRDYNATTTQSDYGENLAQLLDFLRLKASYERNTWQLRPLHLVHDLLVRRHRAAADFWREQVRELTTALADQHLRELEHMERKYGMRLRALSDRFQERFVKPMEVDGLCALVEPAMAQAGTSTQATALERELEPFAAAPVGSGLEVPAWLRRLEAEVHRVRATRTDLARLAEASFPIPRIVVPLEDLHGQIEGWDKSLPEEEA
jgi:hypothetical protein